MIKELRIKCPSCGVILDVRNSKEEAVKRVTCPKCKKQLAVDFQEKPAMSLIEPLYYGQLPISLREGVNHVPIPGCEHLEIDVVRIDNGSYKTVVKATSGSSAITLNGTPLEADDEVVLAKGDKLTAGGISLTFGAPTQLSAPDGPVPGAPKLRFAHHYRRLLGAVAMIVAVFAVYLLWPKSPERPVEEEVETVAVADTTPVVEHPQTQPAAKQPVAAHRTTRPAPEQSITSLGSYDLEQLAIKGNVAAQYELAKRFLAIGDSVNTVKGIQYLKLAQRNGSSEAGNKLRSVYDRLEAKAAGGDRTAENILIEQR